MWLEDHLADWRLAYGGSGSSKVLPCPPVAVIRGLIDRWLMRVLPAPFDRRLAVKATAGIEHSVQLGVGEREAFLGMVVPAPNGLDPLSRDFLRSTYLPRKSRKML